MYVTTFHMIFLSVTHHVCTYVMELHKMIWIIIQFSTQCKNFLHEFICHWKVRSLISCEKMFPVVIYFACGDKLT